MTPIEKAEELIEKFSSPVRTSDFHVPKFITGVECADGSPEYSKILENETISVAVECAIICVEEILKITTRYIYGQGERADHPDWEYWQSVLTHLKQKQ